MSKQNTTTLVFNGYQVFCSYATPVAALKGDTVFVNQEKYSNTTSKHLNKFLSTIGNRKIVPVPAQWFADNDLNPIEGSKI